MAYKVTGSGSGGTGPVLVLGLWDASIMPIPNFGGSGPPDGLLMLVTTGGNGFNEWTFYAVSSTTPGGWLIGDPIETGTYVYSIGLTDYDLSHPWSPAGIYLATDIAELTLSLVGFADVAGPLTPWMYGGTINGFWDHSANDEPIGPGDHDRYYCSIGGGGVVTVQASGAAGVVVSDGGGGGTLTDTGGDFSSVLPGDGISLAGAGGATVLTVDTPTQITYENRYAGGAGTYAYTISRTVGAWNSDVFYVFAQGSWTEEQSSRIAMGGDAPPRGKTVLSMGQGNDPALAQSGMFVQGQPTGGGSTPGAYVYVPPTGGGAYPGPDNITIDEGGAGGTLRVISGGGSALEMITADTNPYTILNSVGQDVFCACEPPDAGSNTIALPSIAGRTEGSRITFKDALGQAGTNNIVITPGLDGGSIDGEVDYGINVAGGAVTLVLRGTTWLAV